MFRALSRLTATNNKQPLSLKGLPRLLHSCDTIINPSSHGDAHKQLIAAIRQHLKHHTHLSNIALVDALRLAYPSFTLTQTPHYTGLKALSLAGKLRAALDPTLEYYVSRNRQGRQKVHDYIELEDNVELGRYSCRWQEQDIYVYTAKFQQGEYDVVANHYILWSTEQAGSVRARSQFADNLIVAALQYNAEVKQGYGCTIEVRGTALAVCGRV